MEQEENIPEIDKETHRLAVLNMDWSQVKVSNGTQSIALCILICYNVASIFTSFIFIWCPKVASL